MRTQLINFLTRVNDHKRYPGCSNAGDFGLIKMILPYQHRDPFGILCFSPFPRHTEARPSRRAAADDQRQETSSSPSKDGDKERLCGDGLTPTAASFTPEEAGREGRSRRNICGRNKKIPLRFKGVSI